MKHPYPYAEWRPSDASEDEYLFDEARANDALQFIEGAMVLSTGKRAGKRLKLISWQRENLIKVFGTVRWSEEQERYVRQYTADDIWIPRKNGKSTFIAAIGIYLCCKDPQPGQALVIVAALSIKQATAIFRQVKNFIARDPFLKKAFKVRPSAKEIEHKASGGILQVIAADPDNALGSEPTAILFDEIAVQKNADLVNALAGGQGSISEPLFFAISTAGYKNQHKYGYERWLACNEVFKDQNKDLGRLVFMCPLDESADWEDEKVWEFANPSLRDTNGIEFLREQYRRVKDNPSQIPWFKAYYLNIWSDSESSWIDMKTWGDSGKAGGVIVEDLLKGRPCYGGLDIASTGDLSSWTLIFPGTMKDQDAPGYIVVTKTWGTAASVDNRVDYMKAKLNVWKDQGWINLTHEQRISQNAIKEQILSDSKKYNIIEIGYDNWNADGIEEDLTNAGLRLRDIPQNPKHLNRPAQEMYLCVKEKQLYHGFNPVLEWNVQNVVVEYDNLDRIVIRKKAAKDKIDAVMALLNAFAVAMKPEDELVPFILGMN